MKRKFDAREIDAFGANRQRLTNIMKELPNYRLLPDNIFDVPQTIVVGKGNTKALAAVNALIDDVRQSGFLKPRSRRAASSASTSRRQATDMEGGVARNAGLLLLARHELDGAAHRAA